MYITGLDADYWRDDKKPMCLVCKDTGVVEYRDRKYEPCIRSCPSCHRGEDRRRGNALLRWFS